MMNTNTDNYYTIGVAAGILSVSIDTLRRWEQSGRVTAYRLDGKNRYFKRSDINQLHDQDQLTSTQAAHMLGLSVSTVRRMDGAGSLLPQRTSTGRRMYTLQAIREFQASPQSMALVPFIYKTPVKTFHTARNITHSRNLLVLTKQGVPKSRLQFQETTVHKQVDVEQPFLQPDFAVQITPIQDLSVARSNNWRIILSAAAMAILLLIAVASPNLRKNSTAVNGPAQVNSSTSSQPSANSEAVPTTSVPLTMPANSDLQSLGSAGTTPAASETSQ